MKKNFLFKSILGGIIFSLTVGACIYAATNLTHLKSASNGGMLTAANRDELVTQVESLQSEINTLKGGGGGASSEIPLGTIIASNGNTSKSQMNTNGWALCDGSSISSQVAGAGVSGYTPNLAGKSLIGAGSADGATFTAGNSYYTSNGNTYYGEVRHTLTINEMPSHNHAIKFVDNKWGDNANNRPFPQYNGTAGYNATTQNAGGGASHNNMPPFHVIQYYMKVKN